MAQKPVAPLKLNEVELEGVVRVAKPKLFKHMADISGLYRSRTLISGGNNYAGFREYCPGDEVRSINWRASVRSRQFQVDQHQQEKSGRWYICLDVSASMRFPESDKWLLAQQLADAFSYILLACGNELGMVAYSDRIHQYCPLGVGRNQYKKLHKLLEQLLPDRKGGDSLLQSSLPYLKQQASVIVISDFLQSDFMRHDLDRLRKAGHYLHVFHVLSRHETDLSANGIVLLADIETGELLPVELTEQARELAAAMQRRQSQALQAYCKEHHFDYSFTTGDNDWKTVILNHISCL
ncbi:MAG: DUF58 domain-containing protein [Methylomonas sp.]|jgi:uncharacterized protein (DUF58 family)|uniref:DUF58 domain-containing protein n=1 Tax=Methylomonas sp. TaxID=418 RepID=UPI0025EA4D14|nr:DUF58 domain-containing protein [Methylomonas sp.]MCK9607051.1 DUF58 domain-containing protein [Methylomonas sp.]